MAIKPTKRCQTSLAIREIKLKLQLDYHYTLIRVAQLQR